MTVLRNVRPLGGDAVDVRIADGVIAEIGGGLDDGDVVDGAGAVLPIVVSGTVDQPSFGLDKGRIIGR